MRSNNSILSHFVKAIEAELHNLQSFVTIGHITTATTPLPFPKMYQIMLHS